MTIAPATPTFTEKRVGILTNREQRSTSVGDSDPRSGPGRMTEAGELYSLVQEFNADQRTSFRKLECLGIVVHVQRHVFCGLRRIRAV